MKIDMAIMRTHSGEFVWEDEFTGSGFLAYPKGADVADSWLEKRGLIEPEKKPEPPVEAPKAPAAKKTAPPANKAVKGPPNDKGE